MGLGAGGLLAVWVTAVAQAPPPAAPASADELLTPVRAAELALASHPSVAAARAERQAGEAEHEESRALFRPLIQLSATATQYEEPAPVSPIHGFRPDLFPAFDETLFQPSVRAGYTLFDGGARRGRLAQTAAQVERAGARLAAEEQALVARVAQGYLRVLSLAEVLAADAWRLEALATERERAGKLFAAGRAAEVEVKRAAAGFAAAAAERAARDARLDQAERALARLIGTEADAARAGRLQPLALGAPPEELLSGPGRDDLERRAREGSPAVAAARENVAAAEAAVTQATAGARPSVQLVGTEVGYGSAEGDFTAEWSAAVQLSLPLFTGGAIAARRARAEALAAAAREQVRAAELAALSDLDAALTALAEASARAASLEAAIASFAEVARIEKLRLEAEAGTQSDYLDAEADLLAARAAWVEARYAALAARVDVARAVGELDPEWLAASFLLAPRPPGSGALAPQATASPEAPP